MSPTLARPDRRHRRRAETLEEILDIAAAAMAEQGAAGLSLGEVARRIGVRTPSLYTYVESKNALYDALFARGWRLLDAAVAAVLDSQPAPGTAGCGDAAALLTAQAEVLVRWALSHPAYAPLMFWRPVPGFVPSREAYEPALSALANARSALADLQARGLLSPTADLDDAVRDWTVLVTGVVTQQLANAPEESYESGAFTAAVPSLVAMFLSRYGAAPAAVPRTEEVP